MLRYASLIIFLLPIINAYSQQPEKSSNPAIENIIEEIAENSDEELDYTTLFDDLNYFLSNPVNLNNTSPEELQKLEILSDFQITNLLEYKNRYGNIYSIYELLLIDGFNKDIIEKIMPFITLDNKKTQNYSFRNALKYGNHQLFIRGQKILQTQKGFSEITDSALAKSINSRYVGDNYKIYSRYKYQYKNKIMWGITAEKDAGEIFLKNTAKDTVKNLLGDKLNNGFDFYSAHLQINKLGIFEKIVIGDFQTQFGQGLTTWSGISYGKSPYTINIKKKAKGLRKYSSTDENNFMRGLGTTIRIKDFDISLFASRKKIDANITITDTLSEEVAEVSSFQTTGLHATPNEIEDKDAVTDSVYGGNITYSKKNYKLGITFIRYGFSAEQNKKLSAYNRFEFNGSSNYNAGIDYQINYKNINFFGESAISKNNAQAFVNGIIMFLHPQMSIAILHRYYQRDYQSYYANAFSESKTSNEQGIYIGTEIFPVRHWKISAYFDNYTFPWLKFRINAPSSGFDYFIQADYTTSRRLKMYWRLKQEIKQQNSSAETNSIPNLTDVNLLKFRYHVSYAVSENIEMRNRLEISSYSKESTSENGYMIFQDIIFKSSKLPLSLAFRYAVFDTDSWDTRIYAYENDVLYGFAIPAYYSKGMRTYINIKYSAFKNTDIWLKYSITRYVDKDIIGSGLTEIEGNKKSEIKLQLRFKF